MADGDKTAALVVALSAQLTKFEKDMKRAGDIADRTVDGIEEKFSRANPSFGGSFFGNFLSNIATKGIETAIKLVSDLVDRFKDLDSLSKIVEVSLNDLFGIQQAANQFSVPIDQANASLKELATLLNRLQRGEKNTLSELFDANPQALKGVNRDALTLQQTLEIVQGLLQNLNRPLDKIDAGRLAGLTDQFALALGRADTSFVALAQKASETAPDLKKAADAARELDEFISKATQSFKEFFVQDTVSFFKNTIRELETIIDLSVKFLSLFRGGPLGDFSENASKELGEFRKSLQGAFSDQSAGASSPRARVLVSGGTVDRGSTNIPKKNTGGSSAGSVDSFERTEESILRHTASVKADTIAVSENTSVQAQLRAEFQLLNSLRRDGGEVTQEQIDQYTKLRASMSALDALTASGIQLTERHKESFLSASQAAAAASAEYTKAADNVAKINSASAQLGSALSNSFSDAIVEGKKLNEVFSSLLKSLAKMVINSAFQSIFSPQAGGGFSPFGSLFSGIGRNAGGTDNWRGGPTWVGENGPEIVDLPRGARVIPNNVATQQSGGSVYTFAPQIDARGADVAAVARIEQVLARQQAEFASNVVATVRKAKTARAL